MILIYLVGIDGSGKTTLAKKLESLLSQDKKARYFYARHFPVLLAPFKFLASKILLKETDEFKDYEKYIEKKQERSRKLRFFAWIYAFIWMLDYFVVTYLRFLKYLLPKQSVIIDRYYYDVAVNISITLGLSLKQLDKLVGFWSVLFPKPSITFFLDLPEDIAFKRKDDIQSISFLAERRKRYQHLSNNLDWIKIDAAGTAEESQNQITSYLHANG